MNIMNFFDKGACSLDGDGSDEWTWQDYFSKRPQLESQGVSVVLVDMIEHPVPGAVPISNELFQQSHPQGTVFVLYCHSGRTSAMMQKKLRPLFPQYTFINLKGGIGAYHLTNK